MSAIKRNNVNISGNGTQPMLFAHGFGCDQLMWRLTTPAFEEDYKLVLFDHVGAGKSDLAAYDRNKYSRLDGYAEDITEIITELDLKDIIFVGHSVSSMIGALAAIRMPERFSRLIMIGPSPRYLNDGEYAGGFTREGVEELLSFLDQNHLGWAAAMAPVIMGSHNSPELAEELQNSFCATDPDIARRFARVTFLSDNRADLAKVSTPSLILQAQEDAIAPIEVGRYCSEHLADSELVVLNATGHCAHISAPGETVDAIKAYLKKHSA